MRIPIQVDRLSCTTANLLTTEDAQLDGFLTLGHLLETMRKQFSNFGLDDAVTIYNFHRTDREGG